MDNRTIEQIRDNETSLIKELQQIQQRVEKGIEFLKQNAIIDEDVEQFCDDLRYDDCKKLLDILKGNDN